MINISKLYCDQMTPGDWLRYGMKGSGERAGETVPKKASERKPIVVWNYTSKCNLKCVHCYNDSGMEKESNESTTEEAKVILDDLADFGVPSVLFSGGGAFFCQGLFFLFKYVGGKRGRGGIFPEGPVITADPGKEV